MRPCSAEGCERTDTEPVFVTLVEEVTEDAEVLHEAIAYELCPDHRGALLDHLSAQGGQ